MCGVRVTLTNIVFLYEKPKPELKKSRKQVFMYLNGGEWGVRGTPLRSGPSQRLLRPRGAGTCIRRAPPPILVRGWTSPRTPHSPPVKRIVLITGPTRNSRSITNPVARPSVAHRDAPRDNFGWRSILMCLVHASKAHGHALRISG